MGDKCWAFGLGRFCLVGASGVLVNLAVFQAGIIFGLPMLIASALAFVIAASSNFFLNRAWTFGGAISRERTMTRWARFLGASLGGLAVNLAVLSLLTGWLGLWHLPGQLAGISAGTLINFQLSRSWVFSKARPAPGLS